MDAVTVDFTATDRQTLDNLADLAAAKLDEAISTRLPGSVAQDGVLTQAALANIAPALLDAANGVESGKTLRQALRIIAAVVAGKVSGAGTGTETFRSLDDTANRAVVTVDANGNRTAVNYP